MTRATEPREGAVMGEEAESSRDRQTADPAPRGVDRAAEWVYRGVWRSVASLFKVPPTPPELPSLPGDTPRSFHPSRSYLRYLKLYFWIAAVAIDVLIRDAIKAFGGRDAARAEERS